MEVDDLVVNVEILICVKVSVEKLCCIYED